jgi:hypothetical protein
MNSTAEPRRPHLAILGAGPTGLEAALAAVETGHPFTLYEAGDAVAAHVRDWGHVRLFSPWDLDVSPRARGRLASEGVEPPPGDVCPTGAELVDRLLAPLAELPEIRPNLHLGTRVLEIGREGLLKHEEIGTPERRRHRFRLLTANGDGGETVEHADVVLDCTGSYTLPNALGDGGIPAPGERALETRRPAALVRRIPDVVRDEERWAGRTVLLVGAGHSAQTAARDLAALAERRPGTRVIWALRRPTPTFEAIPDDPLPERSRLLEEAAALAGGSSPAVAVRCGVVVEAVDAGGPEGSPVQVTLRTRDGDREEVTVDRILALTGSVGDHLLYRQLQVHECYATSGPMKLAAALLAEGGGGADCLTQESHGAETLVNPEPGFFLLGSKSYGRNTTFLMRVGWQQVDEVFGLLAAEQG